MRPSRPKDTTRARGDAARLSNRDWVEAIQGRGAHGSTAPRLLEGYLRGVLARMLGRELTEEELAEAVQEALTRIVQGVGSFRGDSAFTTWATSIATRVAFTELRRRRARRMHEGALEEIEGEATEPVSLTTTPPDELAAHSQLLSALKDAIDSQLTDRQRFAILAELRGLPTIEIAEMLGTNQNALYKLTHDARKKLRTALLGAGFSEDALLEGTQGIQG